MDGRGNVSFHPLRFPGEMSTLRNRCFWCVEPMLWRQGGNSGVCQSRIVRRRERGWRFLVRGVNLTSSKLSSWRRGSAIAVLVRGQVLTTTPVSFAQCPVQAPTMSIIPLFVISGSNPPKRSLTPGSSLNAMHTICGRIERDSQSWTRR
jgi:hypothetical protein